LDNSEPTVLTLDMTLEFGTVVPWMTLGDNAAIEVEETAAGMGNARVDESDKRRASAECDPPSIEAASGRTAVGFTWSPMDEDERDLSVQKVFCVGSGRAVNGVTS